MRDMEASQELAVADIGEDNDSGLSPRQIAALEKLEELHAGPAPIVDGKPKYDGRPQIRALQLVYEGRFGGPDRGQGRRRQPRIAEVLAEDLREKKRVKAMVDAIDRALTEEAGHRSNLDAVKLAVELERGEATLKLKEEEHDELGGTKEELLATLFGLVQEPATAAALDGTAEDITDAEVVATYSEDEVNERYFVQEASSQEAESNGQGSTARHTPAAGTNGSVRDSARTGKARRNSRKPRQGGRSGDSGDRSESPNSFLAAKVRRSKH